VPSAAKLVHDEMNEFANQLSDILYLLMKYLCSQIKDEKLFLLSWIENADQCDVNKDN
jgi:cob(I)alamin adenosyltransferase